MPILTRELDTFESNRDALLGASENKFALIKETNIAGIYESEDDAIAEGYSRFGNVPFLVKQILRIEAPLEFASNLFGT